MRGGQAAMVEWKDYIPLGSALIVFLGVVITALVARWNVRTQVTKDLTVNAGTVQLTDRQFQARWEERLESFTKMQGENYAALLERAGEANERLLAEVAHQGVEIKDLRQASAELQVAVKDLRHLLDECEARDAVRGVAEAERDAKLGRMAREIRRLGGNPEC